MPRLDRKTDSRGRSAVPLTFARTRLRALLADVGRRLADDLLRDPADNDLRRRRHLEVDALGRLYLHGVRVTKAHHELLPLELRAVADALDLEALLETIGDALDHVVDQAAGQAVEGPVLAAVGGPRDHERAVLLLDGHVAADALLELALGPLDLDEAGLDLDLDAVGQGDRLLSDPAHVPTKPWLRARRRRGPGGRRGPS
jgi:hypothetical protein